MRQQFLSILCGLALSAASGCALAQAVPAPKAVGAAGKSAASPAAAQPAEAPEVVPSLSGKTLDGKAFDVAKHKGSVVMLMFWSTDCAVCRDKMRELRENAKGWAAKPFVPVLVSVDKRMSDIDSYNAIVNKSIPAKERLAQVWALDAGYKDNLDTVKIAQTAPASYWPLIIVLDKSGKVAFRHQGRMPADVWDDISGLF